MQAEMVGILHSKTANPAMIEVVQPKIGETVYDGAVGSLVSCVKQMSTC